MAKSVKKETRIISIEELLRNQDILDPDIQDKDKLFWRTGSHQARSPSVTYVMALALGVGAVSVQVSFESIELMIRFLRLEDKVQFNLVREIMWTMGRNEVSELKIPISWSTNTSRCIIVSRTERYQLTMGFG